MQRVCAACAVRRTGVEFRSGQHRKNDRGVRTGAVCALWLTLILWTGASRDARAGLHVDVDPPPPAELANPGGSLEVQWVAEFADPPDRIEYLLLDPTRTIVIEQETYDASEGVARTRRYHRAGAGSRRGPGRSARAFRLCREGRR